MKLYTIGHGNLDIDPFINILRANNVYWVADVRSSPYSRRFPQFSRGGLSAALKREGIKYLFVGDKLGGKPMEGESTPGWRQGRLSYELVSTLSRTRRWAEGIEYLSTVNKTMSE